MKVTEQTRCRICRSLPIQPVIDLGVQPLANNFLPSVRTDLTENYIPLRVCFCSRCGLCQLSHVVDPRSLFSDYVYFSAAMPTARAHFGAYAEEVADAHLSSGDYVCEIGSNDGVLLKEFMRRGFRVLGVDPAQNIAAQANRDGIPTLPEFFSFSLARRIRAAHGNAKVVVGNNVVAHIDDVHDLVKGVRELLSARGVFIFEAPHLVDMFERGAFDSIYHEHLSYLALRPLQRLLSEYDMEIFQVRRVPVQGVSLRLYAARSGVYPVQKSVGECATLEEQFGLYRKDTYDNLSEVIRAKKNVLVEYIRDLKEQGKRVAVYGAPARGTVLLNFLSLPQGTFEYATEELSSKIGLCIPGTRIPVVHIEEARKNPPDCFLVLAWNYRDAILEKEQVLLQRGVTFLFPIGEPMVVQI
ncbi:MAG: class I SAM-dependent methyltransferase [bacterium]|nr:class I SAM-dependent methyltransferase [bacterium]